MGKGEEMDKQKLGPWHPEDVKPVHVGVYEVDMKDEDGRAFSKWDGEGWSLMKWERFGNRTMQGAIDRAFAEGSMVSGALSWRGVLR